MVLFTGACVWPGARVSIPWALSGVGGLQCEVGGVDENAAGRVCGGGVSFDFSATTR